MKIDGGIYIECCSPTSKSRHRVRTLYFLVALRTITHNITTTKVLLLTVFVDFEPAPDRLTESEAEEVKKEAESDSESDSGSGSASESHSDTDSSSDIYLQDSLSSADLNFIENLLFKNIMTEFWEVFNTLYTTKGFSERPSGGEISPDSDDKKSPSGSAKQGSKTSPTSNAGTFNNYKRKLHDNRDDNLSDNDDEREPKKPGGRNSTQSEDNPTMLPCPFRKHNPSKYGIYHYQTCALTTFKLHRLK